MNLHKPYILWKINSSHRLLFVRMHEDSKLFTNHFGMVCESLRFGQESFQNGSQITKIHLSIISECFVNHQDLLQNHFRIVCESPIFAPESFQNGSQITKFC